MSTIPAQVAVACSHCGARFRIKEAQIKIMKEMKCLKCGKKFQLIPLPLSAPEAAPAAVTLTAAPEIVPAPEAATLPVPPAPPAPPAPSAQPAPAPAPVNPNPTSRRPVSAPPPVLETNKSGDIVFKCPKCDRELKVPKAYAGKKIRCKQCTAILTVPNGSPAKETPAAVAPPPPEPVRSSAPAPIPVAIPSTIPVAPFAQETPPVVPLATPPAPPPPPPAPVAPAVPKGPAPLSLSPIAPDVKPAIPPEWVAELQMLKDRNRELEGGVAEADRRAAEAENELQTMAGQRAIETVTTGRRISQLETEIRTLKETLAQRETESAAIQQHFEEKLVAGLNAKLQTHREELARYYENEIASVGNRIKDIAVRREELARYFESEQAVAEARIQDIRERQIALKN